MHDSRNACGIAAAAILIGGAVLAAGQIQKSPSFPRPSAAEAADLILSNGQVYPPECCASLLPTSFGAPFLPIRSSRARRH